MGTASIAVTVQRVTCYLPPWLVDLIDLDIGYSGVSRSDVMRRWLERVANNRKRPAGPDR